MQTKVAMRGHLTPTKMTLVKKIYSVSDNTEKLEPCDAGGKVKRCHRHGKQYAGS